MTDTDLKVIYANWPEHYANQRFIAALADNFDLTAFYFDETGTEVIREKAPPIAISPNAKIVTIKDPPLLKLPLTLQMSSQKGNAGWLLKAFMRALLFRRYVKKSRPDLIIGNGASGTNPYGLAAAFSNFHPFVVLIWGADVLDEAKNSFVLRTVARFILGRADGVIVDSAVKANAVRQLGYSKKMWNFPWGLDLDRFSPSVDGSLVRKQLGWEDKTVIISTRNHFPVYGVEDLIRSIPLVIKSCPNARFLIVGHGKLTGSFVNLVSELGVTDYVHFTGRIPNKELPSHLRAAQIYVSTSYSDGASISMLEAMACGLPVVVSDILPNREWIKHDQNGLLTQIKNPEALAQNLIFCIQNPERRNEMAKAGLKVAKDKADWKKNQQLLHKAVKLLSTSSP
ncbi:MAG: glycosyltransferase [Candidatus Bathyarchaeota archaeon]|nr:glycosyltransferase [Candidatus Bathyarchaeota archaeon]